MRMPSSPSSLFTIGGGRNKMPAASISMVKSGKLVLPKLLGPKLAIRLHLYAWPLLLALLFLAWAILSLAMMDNQLFWLNARLERAESAIRDLEMGRAKRTNDAPSPVGATTPSPTAMKSACVILLEEPFGPVKTTATTQNPTDSKANDGNGPPPPVVDEPKQLKKNANRKKKITNKQEKEQQKKKATKTAELNSEHPAVVERTEQKETEIILLDLDTNQKGFGTAAHEDRQFQQQQNHFFFLAVEQMRKIKWHDDNSDDNQKPESEFEMDPQVANELSAHQQLNRDKRSNPKLDSEMMNNTFHNTKTGPPRMEEPWMDWKHLLAILLAVVALTIVVYCFGWRRYKRRRLARQYNLSCRSDTVVWITHPLNAL